MGVGIVVGLSLGRWDIPDWLQQSTVVEPVDPVERGALDLLARAPGRRAMDHLGLVKAVDGLGQRVVVGVPYAAYRGLQAGLHEPLCVADRHVLNASVAVMDQAIRADRLARVERLLERVEHEVRLHRGRRFPAHDATGEDVDDEGDIDPSLPLRDVGEIADPQSVRPIGLKSPFHMIQQARCLRVAHRRTHGLASHDAAQALPLHQALHSAARHFELFTSQLPPDLAHTVDLEVVVPHALDLRRQRLVGLRACTAQLRIGPPDRVHVVGRWGDQQHSADRLDPMDITLLIDGLLHRLKGRSSSACAK